MSIYDLASSIFVPLLLFMALSWGYILLYTKRRRAAMIHELRRQGRVVPFAQLGQVARLVGIERERGDFWLLIEDGATAPAEAVAEAEALLTSDPAADARRLLLYPVPGGRAVRRWCDEKGIQFREVTVVARPSGEDDDR